MLKQCVSLMFLLALISVTEEKSLHDISSEYESNPKDFDYLILRQIWPQSSCMFPGPNTCTISSQVTTWVVHGLWPSIKGSMGPEDCDKDAPFDFNKLKPLVPSLLEFWPNLYTNTAADSFWKHEWDKHGTCALTLPQIKSELDYFNQSLALRQKFDFGTFLKASQVIPDDNLNYDLAKIKFAIKRAINVEPQVQCYISGDVQYMAQMQICLSKQFELVECASKAKSNIRMLGGPRTEETECRDGVPVRYPVIKQ